MKYSVTAFVFGFFIFALVSVFPMNQTYADENKGYEDKQTELSIRIDELSRRKIYYIGTKPNKIPENKQDTFSSKSKNAYTIFFIDDNGMIKINEKK